MKNIKLVKVFGASLAMLLTSSAPFAETSAERKAADKKHSDTVDRGHKAMKDHRHGDAIRDFQDAKQQQFDRLDKMDNKGSKSDKKDDN